MAPKPEPARPAATAPAPPQPPAPPAPPATSAEKDGGPPPASPPQQVASLPAGDSALQVRFRQGSTVVDTDEEQRLAAIAAKLRDGEQRLQLKAYADDTGTNSSKARRLSLSRALAVRSYLIENGMRSTRIDVRALGVARDGGPPDRVDVIILDR
jgi:outer membrane protein OmpA-like peptidoglycan-associated protein